MSYRATLRGLPLLNFLNGARCTAADSVGSIPVVYPATGELLCDLQVSGTKDVDVAVQSCKNAFSAWSSLTGLERGKLLTKAADLIRERLDEIVHAEVLDTGKPITEAREDIAGCADGLQYYAGLASGVQGQHVALPGGSFTVVHRVPLGVCAGIGAWNFPFMMAINKAAPALAVGNTMLFKPSELTPLTAVLLAEIFHQAGLPNGVFNIVQGDGRTGAEICRHPDVAKVSFTGCVPTGKKIMETCAQTVKQVTLELGGKSALLIFDDTPVKTAVTGAIMANFFNQGQVCSNGSRVFVQRTIYEQFLSAVVEETQTLKIGDPMSDETKVGATIDPRQAAKVENYVKSGTEQGGRLLCGGKWVTPASQFEKGRFFSPTVFADCKDDMTIMREEIFGAVMCVTPFDTEEEAIKRANGTPFGLAAGVFTRNLARAHRVSAALEAGTVYINCYNWFPAEAPFGGMKESGFGREGGVASLDVWSQTKSVLVSMAMSE